MACGMMPDRSAIDCFSRLGAHAPSKLRRRGLAIRPPVEIGTGRDQVAGRVGLFEAFLKKVPGVYSEPTRAKGSLAEMASRKIGQGHRSPTWPSGAEAACGLFALRVPRGEASRKAGCRKSARPDVCPAKAGMFSRRQACRGRSQSPVVWIAEVMETETLKPIDKVSPGEATSHRAVIKVNALWPRK
jgi:hypothetical protein